MQLQIRPASTQDIEWILGELRKFSKFFGSKKSLYGDEAHAQVYMANLIKDHIVLVADKDGVGPVGLIAGIVTPHMFNPGIRVLSEMFWWVDEAHRMSRAGLLLFNAFTKWGKENVDWITFALEDHSPVNEKCLTKRGFHLQEKSFLMEVTS